MQASCLGAAGSLQGAATGSFITASFASAISTATDIGKQTTGIDGRTCLCQFDLDMYILTLCGLCDTSQKLQASRQKNWKKKGFLFVCLLVLLLNYPQKKSKHLCRVSIFLWSFPKCLPSFDAVKLIVAHEDMEQSRVATLHAQQGTWLFLLPSSNHAAPFLTVTQISFGRSTRDGKFIMHCGSGEISSFKETNHFHLIKFCGFSSDMACDGWMEEWTKV